MREDTLKKSDSRQRRVTTSDCGWSRGVGHFGTASPQIGETNEEITKKIKAKFLIERICKYEEYPKMVKEAGQHLKRNTMVK